MKKIRAMVPRFDEWKDSVARLEKEISESKQIQEQASTTSLESFQKLRDDAQSKYDERKRQIRALYQKQLDFVNSDKQCSPEEQKEISGGGTHTGSDNHYEIGFLYLNSKNIEALMAELDKPVYINQTASRLNEGCNANPIGDTPLRNTLSTPPVGPLESPSIAQ